MRAGRQLFDAEPRMLSPAYVNAYRCGRIPVDRRPNREVWSQDL